MFAGHPVVEPCGFSSRRDQTKKPPRGWLLLFGGGGGIVAVSRCTRDPPIPRIGDSRDRQSPWGDRRPTGCSPDIRWSNPAGSLPAATKQKSHREGGFRCLVEAAGLWPSRVAPAIRPSLESVIRGTANHLGVIGVPPDVRRTSGGRTLRVLFPPRPNKKATARVAFVVWWRRRES